MSHKISNPTIFDAQLTVTSNIVVTGNVDGRDISADGTAQDSHIADATLHRIINDEGTSATELWSADKISTELSGKSSTGHTHATSEIADFSTDIDTQITIQKGAANGLATLDASSKIPIAQLPSLAISSVTVVANNAARDLLTVEEGDVAVVTDGDGSGNPITFIWSGSAWLSIQTNSDVISVNTQTGAVVLDSSDVAENTNLYYTEVRVSANSDVAANTTHASLANNPHSITATQLGLGNVSNTKVNMAASTAPAVTNDLADGYAVGSTWIDTTNAKTYVLVDSINGAAIWNQTDIASHSDLTDIGTNTHDQIDTHISDATLHRVINDSGSSSTELWSSSKITSELSDKATTSHTHTAIEITDFSSAADARIALQAGVFNGLAELDETGKVPAAQLPSGLAPPTISVVADAAALAALIPNTGDMAKVMDSDGANNIQTYIYDGSAWIDLQETSNVISVNGNNGVVSLDTADVAENTNLYYTEVRVSANSDVAANTTHAGLTNNPHSITATQLGLGNVSNTKVNMAASTNPTATDDTAGAYSVGSRWINKTTNIEYVCVDATNGDAIWKRTTEDEDNLVEVFDDFLGSDISLLWVYDTSGTASDLNVIDAIGGQVEVVSGDVATNYGELAFTSKTIAKSANAIIKVRAKLDSTTQTKVEIGSITDDNNFVRFVHDSANSDVNWFSETTLGGTTTSTDTTTVGDTAFHVFEIQYTEASIKFLIDGVLQTTHTTNLATGLMNFYIRQTSNTTTTKSTFIDFVKIIGDRAE
jgi:hypothetical protein